MTSARQLVLQTLEFDSPARVPRQLWMLPWAEDHHPAELRRIRERFPDDIIGAPGSLSRPPKTTGGAYDIGTYVDEWGCTFENLQRGVLISPLTWRKLFKPLYQDYIAVAHAHGKKAFMHSDGFTAAIIPDLIEIGLDALNAQIFTMDIEELGRQFGGKLTFWGELDRQWLLPNATTSEIDAAVRRVAAAFWKNGGAIAQCEFGAGAKPANIWQMLETWESLY